MPIPVTTNTVHAVKPATQDAAELRAISPMDRSMKQLDMAIASLRLQYGSPKQGGGDAFASHSHDGLAHRTPATHATATHAHREPVHQHRTTQQTHGVHHTHATHARPGTVDDGPTMFSKGAMPGTVIGNAVPMGQKNIQANTNFLDQLGGFGVPVPQEPFQKGAPAAQPAPVQVATDDKSKDHGRNSEYFGLQGGGGRSGAVIGNNS